MITDTEREERRQRGLQNLRASVKEACNDPELRRYLDDKKRLSDDELQTRINSSKSKWSLTNGFKGYVALNKKTLTGRCPHNHDAMLSINDVVNDVNCRQCTPRLRMKDGNASFKSFDVFMSELIEKRKQDDFEFDTSTYVGISRPMSIRCTRCENEFLKRPKQLIYEKIGCPTCANKAKGDSQRRSWKAFLEVAHATHGDTFTYNKNPDGQYGNGNVVNRTCKTCGTTEDQLIESHLRGNGCKTCSQKRKHTKESFIELATRVWGVGEFDYSLVEYVNNKVPVTLKCKKGHEFKAAPSNHFNRKGCPSCAAKKFVSAGETEWLNSLNIPADKRNVWVNVNGQKFNVDALMNSTIYEYYGDYWHGNPDRFSPDVVNIHSGMTMQEMHEHTVNREQMLRDGGYVVITMWESRWMDLRRTRPKRIQP